MDSNLNLMSQLRIAQYNIQSIYSKKPLLIKFLQEQNIDICLLNETWLVDEKPIKIPGYNIYYRNAKNKHGGVAILIKPFFKYRPLHTAFYEDIQSIAISISTEIGDLTILCVYSPPSTTQIRLNRLSNILSKLSTPIIVSGDFNAHHVAFGCMTTKSRGQQLYDIIDDCELCILNDGKFTTISYNMCNPSAIDITLVSPNIAPLCEWSVYDDTMGSYHYPTITNLSLQIDKYQSNPPTDKYLYKKADWSKYQELSKESFNNICINNQNPLETYNKFCDQLCDLKNKCVKKFCKSANFITRKPVPWWNDVCEHSVIKSYEALKNYRHNPSNVSYLNYKRIDAIKKRTIKEQKKLGWKNFCDSFNRTTPVAKIWNSIKRFKGLKFVNKTYNEEFIIPLLDKLSNNSYTSKFDLNPFFYDNNNNSNSKFLLQPFTWTEFSMSLNSRKDTTPGLDGLPYILIKNLDATVKELLLHIYNVLWTEGIIPESWKIQCVIPILKPDKSPENPNSYRPISLSSCIGKIFENMVKTRLEWFVEANSIIPNIQYGFRRGKSCVDSFVSLISDLRYAKSSNSSAVCVFLDVKGAFDNVQPEILVKVMSGLGIPGIICKYIYNFLYGRILYIRHNNILHGPRSMYKGTMQGAILSPLLYNIYTSEILKYVNNSDISILQFADDLVIYCVNANVDVGINKINTALNKLYSYYNNELELEINPIKSSALIISKDCPTVDIKYNNNVIPINDSHKFLGVIIDRKLNFEEHIKYIISRAHKGLNIMRCLTGVKWGADPKILNTLYKSIVRSHFDYSCLAYINSSHVQKLDIVQNRALRLISGALCSTPIRAMEAETKIMPLSIRRLLLAERFSIKLLTYRNDAVIKKLVSHQYQHCIPLTTGENLLSGNYPKLPNIFLEIQNKFPNIVKFSPWACYSYSYESIMSPVSLETQQIHTNTEYLEFISKMQNYYRFYTDGSKTKSHVRSAVYDPQINFSQSFVLHDTCSIFTAEAYAVFEALKRISTVSYFKQFIILTDSLSLVHSLVNVKIHFRTNYLIYKIKDILLHYKNKGFIIKLMWIPAHIGITGNEIVDKTAYEGLNSIDVRPIIKIPATDTNEYINKTVNQLWTDFWKKDQETKGRWYASIQMELPLRPWYDKLNIASREFISVINRLRFGHMKIPTHLTKLKMLSDPKCTRCTTNSEDSIEHIVFECRAFSIDRLVLVSELSDILNNDPSRHLQDLLANKLCYPALYKYIKNTVQTI